VEVVGGVGGRALGRPGLRACGLASLCRVAAAAGRDTAACASPEVEHCSYRKVKRVSERGVDDHQQRKRTDDADVWQAPWGCGGCECAIRHGRQWSGRGSFHTGAWQGNRCASVSSPLPSSRNVRCEMGPPGLEPGTNRLLRAVTGDVGRWREVALRLAFRPPPRFA
jgi:hypothetical protein